MSPPKSLDAAPLSPPKSIPLSRVILVAAVLLGCIALAGLTWWWLHPRREYIDLVYDTVDGTPLTLDLDLPAGRSSRTPVILFGPPEGDWERDFKRENRFRLVIGALNDHGYAVATIHYRVPTKHPFPASIEDGKAAVRWLRANARRYRLDPDHIGVLGVSAGGYGACMLGATDAKDGFEGTGGNLDQSSRVQAVVSMGAPVDFTVKTWSDMVEYIYLKPFLGAGYKEKPELYKKASVGTYATADDPPFLLFHSAGDSMVPVKHARTLKAQLQKVGVPITLVEIPGDTHVWKGPELESAIERALEFFDQHLRNQ